MRRELLCIVGLLLVSLAAFPGCLGRKAKVIFHRDVTDYRKVATEIEYPNIALTSGEDIIGESAPRTIHDTQVEHWDMPLEEAIYLALQNSEIFRDLGGVLRTPEIVQTRYGPAIQETDPRFGVEAALSAFDAEFSSSLFFDKNDRRVNNRFLGDLGFFQQDLDVFEAQFAKRAATGSQFVLRKNVEFDNNNAIGNEFPSGSWTTILEGEMRHPLLAGGGVQYNRIAGPDGTPGAMQGVLVARVRTDISLANFQIGLRNFIADVEDAYWELYYAYRVLDANIEARDTALETWRRVYALYQAGRRGGEADKEAQARSQFFRFEGEVQDALAGKPGKGSFQGPYREINGVQFVERRLRLLIGLPINGQRLIRPADEPAVSPVSFDWNEIASEALVRPAELRRQRWVIKGRELELLASRNFLLPNLDLVGLYRFRGFGKNLIDPYRPNTDRFDNAYKDLTSGDFQEWQVGVEFSAPVGFRQGHAAVRNAELRLCRERALLREAEREVVHNLSSTVADMERAFAVLQTNFNRRVAAKQQLDAVQAAYEDDKADFFVVLDAQRKLAEAERAYFESRVEYVKAIRDVHFEKGTLLDYCGISMAEGAWPTKAYADAERIERLRGRPRPMNYVLGHPPVISRGPRPPSHYYQPQTPPGPISAELPLEEPYDIPAPQPQPKPLPDTTLEGMPLEAPAEDPIEVPAPEPQPKRLPDTAVESLPLEE